MSIDPNFVLLTADVVRTILRNNQQQCVYEIVWDMPTKYTLRVPGTYPTMTIATTRCVFLGIGLNSPKVNGLTVGEPRHSDQHL